MGIYKASGTVNGIYLGATGANKAYKGSTPIWSKVSLPDWVANPTNLNAVIEEELPNAGASYMVFIEGGWEQEPIKTYPSKVNSCTIVWSTRGVSQKAFELDDSGNYYYVVWNVPYSGGGGVKWIDIGYNAFGDSWYRMSSGQDDRCSIVRRNGNGNSKIFSTLLLYKKGDGVTVADNTPQEAGYEYVDLT